MRGNITELKNFITNDYVVLDLETTGFSPAKEKIIEMAAVKVRNGSIISSFESFVNINEFLPIHIKELTGINDENLCNAPTIEGILPKFINFIDEEIIIGHNIPFDIRFIQTACAKNRYKLINNTYINTIAMSKLVFPEMPKRRLQDLSKECCLNIEPDHRALTDVLVTKYCYEYMKKLIQD